MKNFYIAILVFSAMSLAQMANSQELKIGIRAGVNYSRFLGPAEEGAQESTSFSNGFHFGINVGYQFNDFFTLQSGIFYIQNGSKYNYEGDGYYIFNIPSDPAFVINDSTRINLNISNAYLSIPITLNIRTLEKWEFFVGVYGSVLISPVGAGKLNFGTRDSMNYVFEQGLDHRYFSDVPGGFNPLIAFDPIQLIVNEEDANIPGITGAYFLHTEKNGNKFNSLDYGLTWGLSHFLNPGLFISLRFDYGLKDLTNNRMDVSLKELDENDNFILRDDFDRNFGFQVSVGFRF